MAGNKIFLSTIVIVSVLTPTLSLTLKKRSNLDDFFFNDDPSVSNQTSAKSTQDDITPKIANRSATDDVEDSGNLSTAIESSDGSGGDDVEGSGNPSTESLEGSGEYEVTRNPVTNLPSDFNDKTTKEQVDSTLQNGDNSDEVTSDEDISDGSGSGEPKETHKPTGTFHPSITTEQETLGAITTESLTTQHSEDGNESFQATSEDKSVEEERESTTEITTNSTLTSLTFENDTVPVTTSSSMENISTVSIDESGNSTVIQTTESIEQTTCVTSTELPTPRPAIKLVAIKVCGLQFYCTNGSRAVCQPNEILIEDKTLSVDNQENLTCSALEDYPWKGCYSNLGKEAAVSIAAGRCVLKSVDAPCSGLPDSYRYDPNKNACRPVSSYTNDWIRNDFCGDDQIYIGTRMGSCRCINRQHIVYPKDQRCYQPYTRGPCDPGQWLVPSSRRQMHCSLSPCPDLADGNHFYWPGDFYGSAGCYRKNTRGPCPPQNTFVVNDYISGVARCYYDS